MIALVNPNTSRATTSAMLRIARTAAPDLPLRGVTAPFGVPLITEPRALDRAGRAVLHLGPHLRTDQAVIVAAFGDPGRVALRRRLKVPVTGIAEASLREAALLGRVAVVTTTPNLIGRIAVTARSLGLTNFAGTWITPGVPAQLHANPHALQKALLDACHRAAEGGAEVIVIGGGPLALAARAIARDAPVPLIEPIPAALRLTRARLARRTAR
ncbi:aspartate/glutamate racemase family protein [Thalassococcus sp. S3]|uniref:aspartate/glutamate racemase family protein n=1 Tax=Thalassococcus sp. S3 TaxID=2017482 RepID=UPI0010242F26|nr:aspartate/glutamate racemase family protein [Thalassococcus sp. S3]QBF32060.1 hydrogenase expression protein HupH [Thalassococcus sp. S3]